MLSIRAVLRRLSHGMTVGVRTIVIDADRRVLLVRHTYTPGWHFPGGGVDVGESAEQAARRELQEEARVTATGPLALHGVFFNPRVGGRDHVVCFRVPDFTLADLPGPTLEIAAVRLFPLDALPDGVTAGTARRLREVMDGTPPPDQW